MDKQCTSSFHGIAQQQRGKLACTSSQAPELLIHRAWIIERARGAPDAHEVCIGDVPFSEHAQAPAGSDRRLIQLRARQRCPPPLILFLLLHIYKPILWLRTHREFSSLFQDRKERKARGVC